MNIRKCSKIIGIIILIILLVLVVYITRNLIILSKMSKANDVFNSNNYHFSFSLNNEEKQTFDVYYKDGKKLEKLIENNKVSLIRWYDEKENDGMILEPLSQTIRHISKDNMYFISDKVIKNTLDAILSNKLKSAINFSIREEKDNDGKYYKLIMRYGIASNQYYFDKDNGNFIKMHLSSIIVSINEIEMNNVTDDEVKKPDLTDYTM